MTTADQEREARAEFDAWYETTIGDENKPVREAAWAAWNRRTPSQPAAVKESLTVAQPAPAVPAGWISVHDSLPVLPDENEDDGRPVYTWDGTTVREDDFVPTYEQPAGPAVGGWLRTDDWFANDNLGQVTHWMERTKPLPPTPTQATA